MEISLSRPDISQRDIEAVVAVLRTPYLSMGPAIENFEQAMARYIGTRFAVAVNSGTSGLHLSVIAAGVKEGHEVITTPFSFVASANSILFERARPVFVDIDPHTLNIDVNRIEEKITTATRAILPVHIFGLPCQMDTLMSLAQRHQLLVLEDACEAMGAEFEGKKAGTFGDAAVFAFYPNKQMTTGEGGCIATDREEWADLFRSLRNQGRYKDGAWLAHQRLAYNYRMDELSAALGLAQLERLDEMLATRERVARWYNERLRQMEGVTILPALPRARRSWFVYVVRLAPWVDRDRVMNTLGERGIASSPYFPPIHLQPFYVERFGYREGDFPATESASRSTLALPFYNQLEESKVDFVCETLEEVLQDQAARRA